MALGDHHAQQHPQQQKPAPGETRKRRPRGSAYALHLWGANARDSGELEYVRRHGEQLIHKVLNEDENWKYVSLKQVQDVRIYTPVAAPEDDHASVVSTTESTDSSRSLSAASGSSTKDRGSAPPPPPPPSSSSSTSTRMLPGRCDFRAMTRVAGSIDTIMEILAADEDREAYWTALNTHKGLRASHMFGSRRLAADAPFPRWSQRYLATRFTKYSTKSVDCCFAEYAKLAPASKSGEPRRGFIYRRSVDESLFEMDAIKARLAKYDDECERMYIQDWLFEVAETQERNVCKVVLTCSVYFSGDYSRSLRSEFHEFTTDVMVQIRKVLAKHWRELQGEPAEDSAHQSAAAMLSNAFSNVKPGQSRYCSVCSAKFSLLRKRHTCRTCCASVCSKCSKVSKSKQAGFVAQPVPGDRRGAGDTVSDRECTLCTQFSDETTDSRSSATAGRAYMAAISSSVSATEYDDEDEEEVALSSTSRSVVGSYDVRKNFFTNTGGPARKSPAATATSSLRGVPRKERNDSAESASSSKSAPDAGVMLLSDLDALTLSGRQRGAAVAAAAQSTKKRPVRTVSEDNVLHARDSSLDLEDLANFTLKLK